MIGSVVHETQGPVPIQSAHNLMPRLQFILLVISSIIIWPLHRITLITSYALNCQSGLTIAKCFVVIIKEVLQPQSMKQYS